MALKNKLIFSTVLYVFFSLCISQATGQSIKVKNSWTRIGAPKGYYKWSVYINEDVSVCKTISYVEYYLHNTFKNPVIKVNASTTNQNFSYTATGWGEFDIRAKIVFKDPRKKTQYVNYWLKLGR